MEAEAEKIDNLIAKDNEILSNLKTYKGFIDSFYDPERKEDIYSRKMQPEEILFMTENMVSSDRNMMSSDKNVGKMGKLGSNKEMNGEQDELVIRFQPSHVL